jgi:predicted Rossmann fold nucleotide-binding protein DprA/Smf involved in DNA uptake
VSALGAGVGGLRAGAVGGPLVPAVVLPPALAGVAGGVVAVAGSRSLPPGGASLVAGVARSLVAAGASLVVGCAVGADTAVVSAVSPAALRVLATFGPGGAGAWAGSAGSAVRAFAAAGGAVVWWAGGGPTVPLRARLAARTRAVVAEASAGLVVFFGSPMSRGSVLAAQLAAARGLPVVAFPLGFAPAQLPLLGCGSWAPAGGSGVWAEAWVLVPQITHYYLF